MPDGWILQCVVVTPERAVLDEAVEFVALPMYDGEVGVLPGRAPLIGRLGYGELRTKRGNDVKRFYIDGGFAQVRGNVVTVLTPRALPAEEIAPDAASRALQEAMIPGKTPAEQDAQLRTQERARAQLRVLRHREEETTV
ncbi:MAG: ATP synthase F1 subunit epsilon [Gemmataceae bacterium]|nr:ATP synthase F1 subunit epsilon [Gemmataceae bacterium]